MENIKKNFGFGCMRLPLKDGEVDLAETSRMVDYFLEQGFNYFDTAHGYLQGRSETALKACLTSRHPRDSYILTDKLTGTFFKTEADIRPLFQSQLEAVKKVQRIFRGMNLIPCTACRYCTDSCPRQIAIPDLFAVMNTKQIYHDWNADFYYNNVYTGAGRRASDCIQCGRCEKACPQHLPIRRLLTEIAAEFDKQ